MVDEVYLKAQRQKEEEKRKKEEKRKAAAANQGAFSQGFQVKREKKNTQFFFLTNDVGYSWAIYGEAQLGHLQRQLLKQRHQPSHLNLKAHLLSV